MSPRRRQRERSERRGTCDLRVMSWIRSFGEARVTDVGLKHDPALRECLAVRSRRRCSFAEGTQITPFVGAVDRLMVISRVAGVDLRCPVSGEQRGECFIEQCVVVQTGAHLSCVFEQLIVNGCAHPCSCDAITTPHTARNDRSLFGSASFRAVVGFSVRRFRGGQIVGIVRRVRLLTKRAALVGHCVEDTVDE